MSQSVPYRISQAVVVALGAAPSLAGVLVQDNPFDPSVLRDGDRVLFVEDKSDDLASQEGQAEQRAFVLIVGAINRTASARAGADADMQAAKAVVRDAALAEGLQLVSEKLITGMTAPREGRRGYRIEGIDVGGALVITEFSISYRTPAARR